MQKFTEVTLAGEEVKLSRMSGDEDEAEIIDNAVLGMAWMWSDKTTTVNAGGEALPAQLHRCVQCSSSALGEGWQVRQICIKTQQK